MRNLKSLWRRALNWVLQKGPLTLDQMAKLRRGNRVVFHRKGQPFGQEVIVISQPEVRHGLETNTKEEIHYVKIVLQPVPEHIDDPKSLIVENFFYRGGGNRLYYL